MVNAVEKIPIMTNEIIVVAPLNSIGRVEEFTKRIDIKKGVTVRSAKLVVGIIQSYLSGARITYSMNGQTLEPDFEWHALETGKKGKTFTVDGLLVNGVNTFEVVYTTALGVITEQKAVINAELELLIDKPTNSSGPGVEVGKTTETGTKAKIGQALRESADFIVTVSFLGAIVVTGSYLAYSKIKP
jgi:hypothetical protein